jgi:hypothetical protein
VNWNNDSMSCDRARESIADSIIGRGAVADASAVDAHLAGCAACRAYRAECEMMWSALGELPIPAAAPNATARFDAALRTERAAAMRLSRSSIVMRRLLIAAGVVAAMAVGYGAASWNIARSTRGAVAATTDTTQQYLLLLYDTESTGPWPFSKGARGDHRRVFSVGTRSEGRRQARERREAERCAERMVWRLSLDCRGRATRWVLSHPRS